MVYMSIEIVLRYYTFPYNRSHAKVNKLNTKFLKNLDIGLQSNLQFFHSLFYSSFHFIEPVKKVLN